MSFDATDPLQPKHVKPLRLRFMFMGSALMMWLGFSLPATAGDTLTRMAARGGHLGSVLGETMLRELSCFACHQGAKTLLPRIAPKRGPLLGANGRSLTPQSMEHLLLHPSATGQSRLMPDLFHAFEADEKEAIAEALTHYLASIQEDPFSDTTAADASTMLRGRNLYHQVGCVACHGAHQGPKELSKPELPEPNAWYDGNDPADTLISLEPLEARMSVSALTRYLQEPSATFPSAHAPSMKLNAGEARSVAMYLLRGQAAGMFGSKSTVQKTRGIKWHYVEFQNGSNDEDQVVQDLKAHWPGTNPPSISAPVASGIAEDVSDRWKQRQENMALIFSGFIRIPSRGEYSFFTASDDGSRLYVNGQLVVNNDGDHATQEKGGSLVLEAGDHPIKITYYNRGGPAELKVSLSGPGLDKQNIPSDWLFHLGQPMKPTYDKAFELDLTKASQGKAWFQKLACASCHQVDQMEPAVASNILQDGAITVEDGCLAPSPMEGLPRYALSVSEREAIATALNHLHETPKPLSVEQQLEMRLLQLQCDACHERGGQGGPSPKMREFFTSIGETDLGDEGRIPPHLTGVGRKLKPSWMKQVIEEGASVRPYMATRMPSFGKAHASVLTDFFLDQDRKPSPSQGDQVRETSLEESKYGRKLVGATGMGCIACHTFGQFGSLGIPALDLTTMADRLEEDWFKAYLVDPQSLRPGTRMPSFWPSGQSVNQDILAGDTDRQIQAIWSYLKLADETNPPEGLVQGQKEIKATSEAIMYRNFIEGAGARAIGVGYPEHVNLAFDANQLRAAMIWQGAFMDGARHSNGRGQGFEPPLGHNLFMLPEGPPFAFSVFPEEMLWPDKSGKEADYGFKGYWLDSQRRPKFMYRFLAMDVEDYWMAIPGELDASFRRFLQFDSKAHYTNLWMRAATGTTIEEHGADAFLIDKRVIMSFELDTDKRPVIQISPNHQALLVPIDLQHGKASITQEIKW